MQVFVLYLADVLIKPGEIADQAKSAINGYQKSELPVYAIKEFKSGPLSNYIWFHNKLVTENSLHRALNALHAMSLTPRRYTTATAIEAIKSAAFKIKNTNLSDLVLKYGNNANIDTVMCDRYRLTLKRIIMSAWKKRRQVTTDVVMPLSCYQEFAPLEDNKGLINNKPFNCKAIGECSLATALKSRKEDLKKLKKAVDQMPDNREKKRRQQALRSLIRTPKIPMTEKTCRSLGDVIFAFFAPDDATILTTNIKDHEPLAKALGKKVEKPY